MSTEEKLKQIGYKVAADEDIDRMNAGTVLSWNRVNNENFTGIAVSIKSLIGVRKEYMFLTDADRGGFVVGTRV